MADQIDLSAQISEWREQLLDLTKRNRLINCRVGKTGALELMHPISASIWQMVVAKMERGQEKVTASQEKVTVKKR